jgi:hypothetical protein
MLTAGIAAAPILSFFLALGAPLPAAAQAVESKTYDMEPVAPYEFRGDVRDLAKLPSPPAGPPVYRPLLKGPPDTRKAPTGRVAAESISIPLVLMPSPIQNFAGLNSSDLCAGGQCGGTVPPDTNGDVGPNHYIEAVNKAYAIYDKTGIGLAAFTENQLWSGAGSNPCNGNSVGDPIVLYDPLADRWILTNLAFAFVSGVPVSPFYECVAASKTSDPVAGGWWLYALRMDPGGAGFPPVGTLNDYPKFGIWPDCLYMASNEFTEPGDAFAGTVFASLSRTDLESGAPLTEGLGFINNTSDPFTMIPSNMRGTSPAPGTPNYFVSQSLTAFDFEVRKFTAGTNCGGGGTLSAATNVSQTSYTVPNGSLAPQPNTANLLDSLGSRLMQKVQYRKVGGAESLWVVHTVKNVDGTLSPQWAQIDVTGGTVATTPVQQQIYEPDTTLYRWMGSIAADSAGNVALGYSTSNGTSPNFPSIAYSGRLAGDPLNSLPQTEKQLIAGAGSQTNACGGAPCHRWGDYTAMSVDPVDDCTFWYTNEYYSSQTNGTNGDWQTRIGSFKFPSCVAATPTPTASMTPTPTMSATPTASMTPTPTPTATQVGVASLLTIKPSVGSFGNVKVGRAKFKTLTLGNAASTGGAAITFGNPIASVPPTVPQEFGFSSNPSTCPAQLAPKKKCKLTLELLPASKGPKASTVTIFDNAANANQMVPLIGNGK